MAPSSPDKLIPSSGSSVTCGRGPSGGTYLIGLPPSLGGPWCCVVPSAPVPHRPPGLHGRALVVLPAWLITPVPAEAGPPAPISLPAWWYPPGPLVGGVLSLQRWLALDLLPPTCPSACWDLRALVMRYLPTQGPPVSLPRHRFRPADASRTRWCGVRVRRGRAGWKWSGHGVGGPGRPGWPHCRLQWDCFSRQSGRPSWCPLHCSASCNFTS